MRHQKRKPSTQVDPRDDLIIDRLASAPASMRDSAVDYLASQLPPELAKELRFRIRLAVVKKAIHSLASLPTDRRDSLMQQLAKDLPPAEFEELSLLVTETM